MMSQSLSLFLLLGMAAQSVATNGAATLSSSVAIEDVHLISPKVGEVSLLQFRIRNDSRGRLVLQSVKSEYFSSTNIMARVGASEWVEAGSIAISADSTLDLGLSHLRVIIAGLKSELPANSNVPVEFQFSRGSVPVDAHVTKP